ncbi:MAG: hypothetical protein QM722_23560 [Piscinibacter sp.]
MNTSFEIRRLSSQEQAALMDAARRRAVEARREAIDQFWNDLARALARARLSLRRHWLAGAARSRGAV